MTTSNNNQDQKSLQPLEQDEVLLSSTQIETESSDCPLTKDNILFILMATTQALSRNISNKDVWYLTFSEVKELCIKSGMDEDKVNAVLNGMAEIAYNTNQQSSVSSMF